MTFPVYDKLVQLEREVGNRDLTPEQIEEYKQAIQMLGPNKPTLEVREQQSFFLG